MTAPHRNRVTPTGEILAIPLRGAWTGNRGNLHRGREIVRPWANPHWLICTLEWKGLRREQWQPGRLTWLYFHDEAVAFAAGHRPCAYCRRAAYHAFRAAWVAERVGDPRAGAGAGAGAVAVAGAGEAGGAVRARPPSHAEIDRRLHAERVIAGTRARRTHRVRWPELPDGAFVVEQGAPALVRGRSLVAWAPGGYGPRRRRPRGGEAEALTPPATLAVLRAGYPVQIDPTVA